MFQRQTFLQPGGLTYEQAAEFLRKQAEEFMNKYLQSHQIVSITESFTPNGHVALTIWFKGDVLEQQK